MTDYITHRATVEDAKTVAILIGMLLHDFNIKAEHPTFKINVAQLQETSKELLAKNNFAAFILFEKEAKHPLGVITVAPSIAIYNGGEFGVITELYVDASVRNKGLGKTLIKKALDFAQEQGWKKVEVGAPRKAEWPNTVQFYKSRGFEERGPKFRINVEPLT